MIRVYCTTYRGVCQHVKSTVFVMIRYIFCFDPRVAAVCILTILKKCVIISQKDIKRGVAQLAERVLWEHQAVGSNPATPTKNPARQRGIFPYSLFTLHSSLFTIHSSLFTIHYSLFTGSFPLSVCTMSLLPAAHVFQFVPAFFDCIFFCFSYILVILLFLFVLTLWLRFVPLLFALMRYNYMRRYLPVFFKKGGEAY